MTRNLAGKVATVTDGATGSGGVADSSLEAFLSRFEEEDTWSPRQRMAGFCHMRPEDCRIWFCP